MERNKIVTSDWQDFGYREREMAKELLSYIDEAEDLYGTPKIMFNTRSGYVFLSDDDFRVWMMNGDCLEEWFTCPYCGYEGFLEDMKHEPEGMECMDFMHDIGIDVIEYEKNWG